MAMAAAFGTFAIGAMSAKGQRAEGKYQEAIMRQNARVAEMQAEDAIDRGEVEESILRLQIRALIGSQRASMGAQGIEINDADESAGLVQLSTRAQGEYDALLIRNNAAREAWGYKVQAVDYIAQGRLADLASKNRARDTILGSMVKAGGALMDGGFGGGTRVPTSSVGGRTTGPAVYSGRTYGLA